GSGTRGWTCSCCRRRCRSGFARSTSMARDSELWSSWAGTTAGGVSEPSATPAEDAELARRSHAGLGGVRDGILARPGTTVCYAPSGMPETLEVAARLDRAAELLATTGRIVAFTGAGVSTESGIPDFRSPTGLWARYDPDDFSFQNFMRSDD